MIDQPNIQEGQTSYFSTPEGSLDPRLFDSSGMMRSRVRLALLGELMACLRTHFRAPESWSRAWLAGSAASYQWSASRQPGDLDILVGIDYPLFRSSNLTYSGLSDAEISSTMNEVFRQELYPRMENWAPNAGSNGFEVTFYVNPGSTNITAINPYAAYSLTDDEWTVHPVHATDRRNPHWDVEHDKNHAMATEIVHRYGLAIQQARNSSNPAARRNAEVAVSAVLDQASAMWERVHSGRKTAFSSSGEGYNDKANYLWQAGKASGWIPAIATLKKYRDESRAQNHQETYGVELPDSQVLIRRALLHNRPT